MSLTCICCKPLEHILVSNTNKHLALDSILADCQHGFRSQRPCETQLVQFVHDIISNLDGAVNRGHKQTDLIIIDFAMAFDKVPHRRLLHKWNIIGLENPPTSGSTRGSLGVLNKLFYKAKPQIKSQCYPVCPKDRSSVRSCSSSS